MRRTYLNFSQSEGIYIIGLAAILNFQKVTFGSIYSSNFLVRLKCEKHNRLEIKLKSRVCHCLFIEEYKPLNLRTDHYL